MRRSRFFAYVGALLLAVTSSRGTEVPDRIEAVELLQLRLSAAEVVWGFYMRGGWWISLGPDGDYQVTHTTFEGDFEDRTENLLVSYFASSVARVLAARKASPVSIETWGNPKTDIITRSRLEDLEIELSKAGVEMHFATPGLRRWDTRWGFDLPERDRRPAPFGIRALPERGPWIPAIRFHD